MALSFINRIWSRLKRTSDAPSNLCNSDSNELPATIEVNTVLQHDLEIAVHTDTAIRQAREIFDINLLEPNPTKPVATQIGSSLFPFSPTSLPIASEADQYAVETPASLGSVTETEDSRLLSFFESLPEKHPTSQTAPDLSSLILFALPFDSAIAPQLLKLAPKTKGRLSLQARAFARASQMGDAFGLGSDEVRTLSKILKRYRLHYAVVDKIETLLDEQYSVDQLFTAEMIRRVWRRSEYARSQIMKAYIHGTAVRADSGSPFDSMSAFLIDNYQIRNGPVTLTTTKIPSWRTAAKWARKLGNVSSSELDSLLYCHYERWTTDSSLWATEPSFIAYFSRLVREMRSDLQDTLPWELASETPPLNEEQEHQLERNRVKELYALGLIPDIWTDPFDERLSIDPTFPKLNDYFPKKGEEDNDE